MSVCQIGRSESNHQRPSGRNSCANRQKVVKELRLALLAAMVGGLCFGLAQVITAYGLLVSAGVALLAVSVWQRRKPTVCALVWGGVAYGTGLVWAERIGTVPWMLLTLWHLVFFLPVAVVAGFARLRERPGISALALGGTLALTEWMRELGMFGVGMVISSGPLSANYGALQWVRLIGASGLGFVVCVWAFWLGLAVAARSGRRLAGAAVAVAFLGGGLWLGSAKLRPAGFVRVAAIQGVTSDGFRPILEGDAAMAVYQRLTKAAAKTGHADLIIWPETSCPDDMSYKSRNYRILSETFNDVNAAGMVGGFATQTGESGQADTRNTVFAFDKEGELAGTYEKMILTPFGEYVPFRRALPSLSRWGALDYDYAPGRYWPPVEAAGARVGVLICSESMFARLAAERARQGATMLAVMSNDSWFGRGAGTLQLERLSALRAVETGRSVVRASETGRTMLISPRGRISDRLPLYTRGYAAGRVMLSDEMTPFVRWQGWVGPVEAALTLLALAACLAPVRRKEAPDPQLRLPLEM